MNKNKNENEKNVMLTVFSGHDTVIAPVLAALGAYTDELCVWPPYASRIVFELWQGNVEELKPGKERVMTEETKKSNFNDSDNNREKHGNIFDNGNISINNSNIANNDMMSYVRVIYNGKDITMKITACQEEFNEISKLKIIDQIPAEGDTNRNKDKDSSKIMLDENILKDNHYYIRNGFCPLSVIEKQSSLMLHPFSTFQEACKS